MKELVWSAEAVQDLDDIYEYIARTSRYYAKRIVGHIIARGKQIIVFPESGVTVPEFQNPRIRQVFEQEYRIIYYIEPSTITVLTIVHGTRDAFSDSV